VGSSPYSTGGGGTRLEQEFAASALASLLLAAPVEGLGDEFTPVSVGLQQERHAPVDDVVVHGRAPGGERAIRVACRSRPTIGPSSPSTVKMFADYVAMVLENGVELDAGTLRLGLAVAGPYGPAEEVADLTEVARRQDGRVAFDAAVAAPGAYSADVRRRLRNVDELVEAALAYLDTPGSRAADAKDVAWHLLRSLFVLQTQLEGDAAPGRTNLVGRLQTLAGEAARAEALRLRLVEIASHGAIRAGAFTRAMLRRELRPFGLLAASPDFVLARPQVELLEAQLTGRTRRSLHRPGAHGAFVLDRSQKEEELAALVSGASPGHVVIVRGEPDVGKSALALTAVERIRHAGGAALVMSLRDLPSLALRLRGDLGLSATELLAAAPSAPVTVLLLDGAEAVQEGNSGALTAMLAAAAEAGMTPVLVLRDDAHGAVMELVQVPGGAAPLEFVVAPLTDSEIQTVVAAIPEVSHLAADARAVWLLRRLGLVELLLRAVASGSSLPQALSSEADVLAAVWTSLVRRNGRMDGVVSPDDRDAALTGVARRLVTGVAGAPVPGAALLTLRSDGLLLSRSRASVWQATDSFASDLLRDFATVRLLLTEGLDLLVRSPGPRWAIRAGRLYAQARLSEAVVGGAEAFRSRWTETRSEFAALAEAHGPRWAELPWEALLSAGWAPDALAAITAELLGDPGVQDELMRAVRLRFSPNGPVDPMVAGPVVAWFLDARLFGAPRSYHEDPIGEFVRSWLQSVAFEEVIGRDITRYRSLRGRIRDELLAWPLEDGPEKTLLGIALLGSDSNGASDGALRMAVTEEPDDLREVVEAPEATMLLAQRDSALLAELAEAYYIEPEPGEEPSPWGRRRPLDQGIRRHRWTGPFEARVGRLRGPFLPLLRVDLNRGLATVERMLTRAATDRVQRLLDLRSVDPNPETGVQMTLFGSPPRWYTGDSHVWYWYRGSAVGPEPCISALLALETVMDELVSAGLSLRNIGVWLLRNAQTLATPGLLYGFLVRHIDEVTDELNDFLAIPDVWELEFERTVREGVLHLQGADPDDLVGRDRRTWSPANVAAHLVITAAQKGDDAALERLRGVGRRLLETGGGTDALAQVKQFAAGLDWDAYELHPQENGYVVQVKAPEGVEEELAPVRAESDLRLRMYGMMRRYRLREITPYRSAPADLPDEEQLAADLEAVEEMGEHLADSPLDQLRLSFAGLAAALIHAAVGGKPVETDLLRGAVDLLINSAVHPYIGDFPIDRSVNRDGADRKAALVLPSALLLLARSGDDGTPLLGDEVSQEGLEEALRASATSLFLEVRWNASEGARAVLAHPCGHLPDRRCWHEPVWQTIEAGARNTVLGEARNFHRETESLEGDLAEALRQRPDEDLMLTHIVPVAASILHAATSRSCVRDLAVRLLPALLEAYARAARYWAEGDYEWPHAQQAAFASAVLHSDSGTDESIIVDLATRLHNSPDGLGDFLGGLIVAATYEPEHAAALGVHWPTLMQLGIESLHEADRSDRWATEELVRRLVPSPTTLGGDGDAYSVIERARGPWLSLDAVSGHIDSWLMLARDRRWCVDALIGFLQTQPLSRQADPGLDWVQRLVVGDDGSARTSGFLVVEWLQSLRESNVLRPATWPKYRAIVDALVLGDYRGARDLQRRDETF
jgi:hypothetical protein